MTTPSKRHGSGATESLGRPLTAVLAVLLVMAGPAGAAWWWPTQGDWMETHQLAPDDADERGVLGGSSHWGVHFGSAVAADGETLAISTQFDRHGDGFKSASGDGADWVYLFEREPGGGWVQVAKLVPNDAQEGDSFGYSVALDVEAGVGVAGNPAAQKIYIFERGSDGIWAQAASFERPEVPGEWPELFGYSVGVSGDIVVAGWHPTLFLYENTDQGWEQADSLPGGIHVALQESTLVASIWDQETDSNEYAVYTQTSAGWSESTRLDPGGAYDNDNTNPSRLGLSEAGDQIILGAPTDQRVLGIDLESRGAGLAAVGSAWIIERLGGEWVQTAELSNPNPSQEGGLFGRSVAIQDDIAIIGAPGDPYNGATSYAGAAYVYKITDGDWVLDAKLRNHDAGPYAGGDTFGQGVGIGDGFLAVGAPFDDQRRDGTPEPLDDDGDVPPCIHRDHLWGCDEGENAGSVYIFERPGTAALGGEPLG